jgi:hypothetical protein
LTFERNPKQKQQTTNGGNMKSLRILVLAITLIGLCGVGNVFAAGTATLDVTANVIEACQFDSDGGTLDFGSIDALAPADQTGVTPTLQPKFTCSNGTGYTITDDSATELLDNTIDTIAYSLNYTGSGTATGSSTDLDVTGDLLGADYAGKSAGAYSAIVTFSINP